MQAEAEITFRVIEKKSIERKKPNPNKKHRAILKPSDETDERGAIKITIGP